jgi:hypothetical protein
MMMSIVCSVSKRGDLKIIKYDISFLFIGSECSTELQGTNDETEEFNARDTSRHINFIEERIHLIMRKKK